MSGFTAGHLSALSEDADQPGGWTVRCLDAACSWQRSGTEAFCAGAALDHYDETLRYEP